MAGKSKKLKIKKLQINLTNRWLYTLIVFFSLVVIGVFVYAATPNPGHDITQLQPCGAGEILKIVGGEWACGTIPELLFCSTAGEILKSDGTTWTCGIDEVGGNGGTSLWTLTGSDIYYDDGEVGIGTTSPGYTLDVGGTGRFTGALTAATINTGNGAMEVNSIAAYSGNQNLRTTDSPTFGGATINGIFTLGEPTTKTPNAAGAITVTRSYHRLDTRGDQPTDSLETINGGEVGMILVLQTSLATRDVTLKDNDGNLYLDGDFTFTAPIDKIVLIRSSASSWSELSRSDN